MMLSIGEFGAGLNSLVIKQSLMHQLGAACLYRKIILGESYFRLAWIAILSYKVAGIPSQHYIIYPTFSTGAQRNHFPDTGKMVGNRFTCIFTRFLSACHNIFKSFPFRIT